MNTAWKEGCEKERERERENERGERERKRERQREVGGHLLHSSILHKDINAR